MESRGSSSVLPAHVEDDQSEKDVPHCSHLVYLFNLF